MISFTLKSKTNQEGVEYSLVEGFGGLWGWRSEGNASYPFHDHPNGAIKDAIASFEYDHGPIAIEVTLFKESGKYYTTDFWEKPANAIGPYDMVNSPDFRRIGEGAVLINSQEPWGFPHLFPGA